MSQIQNRFLIGHLQNCGYEQQLATNIGHQVCISFNFVSGHKIWLHSSITSFSVGSVPDIFSSLDQGLNPGFPSRKSRVVTTTPRGQILVENEYF